MRFKVDENLPIEVAALLRAAQHDAMMVTEQNLRGENDARIANLCRIEGRILVTLDMDFSDVRVYPPQDFAGLMVLRINRHDKIKVIAAIQQALLLLEHEPIVQRLWIVEEHRVRIRGEE